MVIGQKNHKNAISLAYKFWCRRCETAVIRYEAGRNPKSWNSGFVIKGGMKEIRDTCCISGSRVINELDKYREPRTAHEQVHRKLPRSPRPKKDLGAFMCPMIPTISECDNS
jgi:hypothetical protein